MSPTRQFGAPIVLLILTCLFVRPAVAQAQIDQARAARYFDEAETLCEREGGRLWGVSLCGPMVFADAATNTVATNQPPPVGNRPALLGIVNAPIDWAGAPWSAYVWAMLPDDDAQARGRLLIHELFHRVQPELGLAAMGPTNDHLDTLEGRYWLRLEWRALVRALGMDGVGRTEAVRDALAFRVVRRAIFPGAADSERADETREGLAQYTGTVVAASSDGEAILDAIRQLKEAETAPTFVRTFGYPSGTAYGLLLDTWSPGWTRRFVATDDLGELLMNAAMLQPAEDVQEASRRYDGPEVWGEEETRDAERRVRVAELHRRFVDGPVLVVPRGRGAMLVTTGATPIPGEGTVFFEYRVAAEWGRLESTGILESVDGATLRLPLPFRTDGAWMTGENWTIALADGWTVVAGRRAGDLELVREESRQ